jgi:Mn-dependent DtxR family transcriptional regulator
MRQNSRGIEEAKDTISTHTKLPLSIVEAVLAVFEENDQDWIARRIMDVGLTAKIYEDIEKALAGSKNIKEFNEKLREITNFYISILGVKIFIEEEIDEKLAETIERMKKTSLMQTMEELFRTYVRLPHYECFILALSLLAAAIYADIVQMNIDEQGAISSIKRLHNTLLAERKMREEVMNRTEKLIQSGGGTMIKNGIKNVLMDYKANLEKLRGLVRE